MAIIAHDLGTTGNKASLYDNDGLLLATSFVSYETRYPYPGWAEQDPSAWWAATCRATMALMDKSRTMPADVACLVFSGQMQGCLPVDRSGIPLRNSMIWADTRSSAQAEGVIRVLGEERVYAITGHRASPSYSLAKLLWIRDNEPGVYKDTYKILQAKDYVVHRLTGRFATDHSDASGTGMFDLERLDWSQEILAAMKIDETLLPESHLSTDVVGAVTSTAAAETGLAPGTPVVIGGGDGACAAAGAGVVRAGVAYGYIGSSAWIGMATSQPLFDPNRRTVTFAHVVPGLYAPTGTMQAAGISYEWARQCIYDLDPTSESLGSDGSYEAMDRLAESTPAAADGLLFLPYLLGERSPRWNALARGAFVGISINHSRAHMLRAVLEGVALNLRVILDAFEEQGPDIDAVRLIGGGARSALWRQIIADVFGRPVLRLDLPSEATSFGAAIAGGVGVGLFKDFSIAEVVNVEKCSPSSIGEDVYRRPYEIFNLAYEALKPIFDALASADRVSADRPDRDEQSTA